MDGSQSITLLYVAAAWIGLAHTLLGPDHYLPFLAMSRAGGWTLRKTLLVTLACGIGHVLGSIVLGTIGIVVGVAVFKLETIEDIRGDVAGWLLLAFGALYFAWGVRRAIRNRPHTHAHAHGDGTVHAHRHMHRGGHLHVHQQAPAPRNSETSCECFPAVRTSDTVIRPKTESSGAMTPWVLFTIFVFGPCEPLIPVLMYPAAKGQWWDVALVAVVFGITTLATMVTVVALACVAIGSLNLGQLERYGHALAGFVILLCGAAVQVGL